MSRRKKFINNTDIPQYQIEAIARCIMPDILTFYESEEGHANLPSGMPERVLNCRNTKKNKT